MFSDYSEIKVEINKKKITENLQTLINNIACGSQKSQGKLKKKMN